MCAIPGYEVLRVLNECPGLRVVEARRLATGDRALVKVFEHAPAGYDEEYFERELDLVRQLGEAEHEGIARFLEDQPTVSGHFFALELVGPSLAAYQAAEGRQLPVEMALSIVLQVAAGLSMLHDRQLAGDVPGPSDQELERHTFAGLVHRDVTPGNIFLSRSAGGSYIAKLGDFGLSKLFDTAGHTQLTGDGEVRGAPPYMPPEQVYDYRYLTPTADVYSLGAVLYEMLSGHYARGTAEQWEEARTASDALEIVLEQEIMPIEQRVAGLSEPLVAALARALADDPARRYPNAGAFQSALERVTA